MNEPPETPMNTAKFASRRLALILALGLGFAMAGCKPTGTENQTETPPEKPKIALVMKSLANEFFQTMAEGAREHHRRHADEYELVVNGIKNESDLDQQVTIVEQMIAGGADAIVIAPADSKALVPVCKRALDDAGVVVVNIDNKFDAGVLEVAGVSIPFVGPDNREGARMVGDVLAEHLERGDPVAILEGIPTAFNAQQRRAGFEEAMETSGMDIVSVQSGYWEMDKANRVAAAILSEHPDLKAFLCSNDSMALGAVAAVKAAGKSNQVQVVGFDNISAIQEMVRDGRVLATADQHGDQLAVYGIEYALQILRDHVTPEDKQTPVDLITRESLTSEP